MELTVTRVSSEKEKSFAISISRKFRKKIRKFHEKNIAKISRKIMWKCEDRNLKRLLLKLNSLHLTFIKVKEEKLLNMT